MSANVLYTDLSGYYDLMCADINYREQSAYVRRIHQIFSQEGGSGLCHLDLACGTGPHVRHFIDFGYRACGLDINQPMLDIAQARCPEARFTRQDMLSFTVPEPVDLVTCFLYSIHYNQDVEKLQRCLVQVHSALNTGGVFCFNAVDKNTIDSTTDIKNSVQHEGSRFVFQSGWRYSGTGDQQTLALRIEKTCAQKTEVWQDHHAMVAVGFSQLQAWLAPYFEVLVFAHNYEKIIEWDGLSGNAIFVCVKK